MKNILTRKLWGDAEAMAKDMKPPTSMNVRARSALPYMKRSNVKGAHVYQAHHGGWMAEVHFRDVPFGQCGHLATRPSAPHRSRKEAMQAVVSMLSLVLTVERMKESEKGNGVATFTYYDLIVPLQPEAITHIISTLGHEPNYHDYAASRLAEVEQHFDGDFSMRRLATLDHRTRLEFLSVIHNAAATGILQWPEEQPLSATGHAFGSDVVN